MEHWLPSLRFIAYFISGSGFILLLLFAAASVYENEKRAALRALGLGFVFSLIFILPLMLPITLQTFVLLLIFTITFIFTLALPSAP